MTYQAKLGATVFTVTPEFGPPPYMWTNAKGRPLESQWDINVFMKELIKARLTIIV